MKNYLNVSYLNQLIDEAKYDECFNVLHNNTPATHQNYFNELRNEFINNGTKDSNFHQRLKTLIRAFLTEKKHLNILVLTCNLSQVKDDIAKIEMNEKQEALWQNFKNEELLAFYGEELAHWKPYKEETIVELLENFRTKFGIEIIYDVCSFDNENHAFDYIEKIDSRMQEMVLISDVWALANKTNTEIAKKFDSKNVRGCIIPIFENLDNEIKSYLKNRVNVTFKTVLCRCVDKYYEYSSLEDTGFVYIDLEVPNKHDFFRKLKHIVYFNPIKISSYSDLNKINVPNIGL